MKVFSHVLGHMAACSFSVTRSSSVGPGLRNFLEPLLGDLFSLEDEEDLWLEEGEEDEREEETEGEDGRDDPPPPPPPPFSVSSSQVWTEE